MHRPLLLAAVFLALAGCGGEGTEVSASPTSTVTTTATPPSTDAAPAGTEDVTVVEIVIADGEVVGGPARTEVDLGDTVRFDVTSDTDDHVHVHGYDLFADVEAGGTAELEFTADIPGQFEVELEDAGFGIAELVVRG